MFDPASLQIPWITLTVFTPLIGAVVLAMVPAEHTSVHRTMAAAFMSATFLISLALLAGFDASVAGYQLTSAAENVSWIPGLGARYHVGIDGISLWLVLLTTFLGPIVVISGYSAVESRVKEYHIALLVLQTAMLGAFVSLDLLLFYVFWELMLVPMYLLIGVWGGQNRIYAAVKLFLYTMLGSVLMLIGIVYLYLKSDMAGFGIAELVETARLLTFKEQAWIFAAFALAFLIKVPLFPFHTWLPDAHVQAPTAGSVILASILLKMGTYGLIRYAMPMFPDAVYAFAPYIAVLSIIGIFYGAVIAYVQTDIKKLVAYSSVSHLGFVTLGLFSMSETAIAGAMFQNLAHGVATGGLFLGIGMIYERRHTRELADFGGLAKQLPVFSTMFLIICFASAGVPGLVGFVGEFLILTGASESYALNFSGLDVRYFGDLSWGPDAQAMAFVTIAATGVILGALYLLLMVQRMLFGPLLNEENKTLKDLSMREVGYYLPLVLLAFFMGLRPQPFLDRMDASIGAFVDDIEQSANLYGPLVAEHAESERRYQQYLQETGSHEAWPIQAAHASEHGGHGDDAHGDDHGDDAHGDDHGADEHGADEHGADEHTDETH